MPEMQTPTPSSTNPGTPAVEQNAPKSTETNPKAAPGTPTPAATSQAPSAEKQEAKATNGGDAAIRRHKLKIDGNDLELSEPDVIAYASKGVAADKRFKEAADLRKDAETFLDLLKTDFTQLLDNPKLGLDEKQKRELIEKYYRQKYIDPETLSPEQLRLSQAERELSQYKEREKQAETTKQQQAQQQLEQYHAQEYQKKFIRALETNLLPKEGDAGARAVARMAALQAKTEMQGLDHSPEHLASLVRQDYITEIKAIVGATEGDALLTLLGDDIVNKLRKADLARLRAQQPQAPKPVVETAVSQQPKTPLRPQSFDEMRAERDQKAAELQKSWTKKATT